MTVKCWEEDLTIASHLPHNCHSHIVIRTSSLQMRNFLKGMTFISKVSDFEPFVLSPV